MPTRLIFPEPSIWPPLRKNASRRPCPAQSKSSADPLVKKFVLDGAKNGDVRRGSTGLLPQTREAASRPAAGIGGRGTDRHVPDSVEQSGNDADQEFARQEIDHHVGSSTGKDMYLEKAVPPSLAAAAIACQLGPCRLGTRPAIRRGHAPRGGDGDPADVERGDHAGSGLFRPANRFRLGDAARPWTRVWVDA